MGAPKKLTTVLITGGRDFSDRKRLYQILDAAVDRLGLTEVIHGAAPGADSIAKDWADARGIKETPYGADWTDLSHPDAVIRTRADGTKYDANAGPRRNQKMLDIGNPDVVIAFKGDRGTRDMIRRARAADVRVVLVDWSG